MEPGADPQREPDPVPPDRDQLAQARRISAELAKLRYLLPGSVTRRYTRCGRTGCRCMADPPQPHGPYWWWTRKVDNKTITQILTDDQYADYQTWFDNARQARALITELETLALDIVAADPRTTRRAGRPTPGAATPPRSQRR
jgi:hypothetical protein